MDNDLLDQLSIATGASCLAIGAAHVATGLRGLPGAPRGDASLDSQERFYGAIFAGYGLLWLRAGRARPTDLVTIDIVSGSMLIGGVARLISLADRGRPHPIYVGLTAVEFLVPGVFFALTRRARDRSPAK